jgi:DNA-binding beta-propeller fold protein YncE
MSSLSAHQAEHADAKQVVLELVTKADLVLGNGTAGDSDGQLDEPWGASFVPSHPEWLVTAEFGNERVKISHVWTGTLVCKLGEQGDGEGQFAGPSGIAVTADSSLILVAEYDNHRVQVLRLLVFADGSKTQLEFVRFIGVGQGSEQGQLTFPSSIALLPDERGQETVLVLEEGNHRVSQFTLDGTFMRIFAGDTQSNEHIQQGNHRAPQVTLDASFVRLFAGGAGGHCRTGNGQLNSPAGITVLVSSGEVAVADGSNNRVQIFDSEGSYKRQFGSKGEEADGHFDSPSDITSDVHGNLLVLDKTNRMQVFSPEGRHLCTRNDLGLSGSADSIKSIAWSAGGGIAVLDGGTNNCFLWHTEQQQQQQQQQEGEGGGYAENDIVVLADLSIDALNGQRAQVLGGMSEKGRYPVLVREGAKRGAKIMVKPEKMQRWEGRKTVIVESR